jgi:hypothetical protein
MSFAGSMSAIVLFFWRENIPTCLAMAAAVAGKSEQQN